jgi:hypothetical protein
MSSAIRDIDREHLAELRKKFQVVRDRVTGVAKGYYTGVIITGRGGTGKSFAATEELDGLGCDYDLHNTHLTPRALFDRLKVNPRSVHVIEDAEEVTRNPVSLGVLRSATWGTCRNQQGRYQRKITWGAHGTGDEVDFEGGIVLISNRALGNLPEMQALATRIPSLDIDVTTAEIAALMRSVGRRGYQVGETQMGPAECLEVVEFIISESTQRSRPLDMRLLINGYADRLQSEFGDPGVIGRTSSGQRCEGVRRSLETLNRPAFVQLQRPANWKSSARSLGLPVMDVSGPGRNARGKAKPRFTGG